MQWNEMERHWPQLRGRVRRHWSRLSEEDVTAVAGRREELIARLEARYGFSRSEAEREVEAWAFLVSAPEAA